MGTLRPPYAVTAKAVLFVNREVIMGKRGNGEGSIYQRKSDGLWTGSISLDNGKRKYFYAKTKKEVTEKIIAARHEHQQGILVTAPSQTLKDYLEHWLEDVQKPTIRISSYVKYRKIINTYVVPVLGKVQLQKLTPQRVQALYSAKLKQGLKPKTVQSIHGVLHKALDNAVKWNLVARNVCDAVSPPRVPRTEKPTLTLEQARMLFEHVKAQRLEVLLTLAITTGMRRGEMLALRWTDIDLVNGSVQVNRTVDYITGYGYVETEPKTAKGRRRIMLSSYMVGLLNAHRSVQMNQRHQAGTKWIDKNLVFCGLMGDFFNPNYLLRVFKRVLIDVGLPHMKFHDLRHSAATILLSMNVHPKIVQEILGHSTISMTLDVYSHVLPSMQGEVVELWEGKFVVNADSGNKFAIGQRVKVISTGLIDRVEQCIKPHVSDASPLYCVRGNWYYEAELESVTDGDGQKGVATVLL